VLNRRQHEANKNLSGRRIRIMKTTLTIAAIMFVLGLTGCGTTTASRTSTGALGGAATGAAIGSLSGDAGKGALIGGAAGALGGAAYDANEKEKERARQERYRQDRYRSSY
jgi:hypothetical protein